MLAGVCALLAGSACATSTPARVALTGNLPALEAAIAEAGRQGELDADHLEELAGAVLRRELASLVSSESGAPGEPFPDVLPCAAEVRSVLEDVASGDSEFAAPAAVTLLDAGLDAPASDGSAVARAAVEARRALGSEAGGRRRAFMLHGDASVRRAALSAALDSADAADLAALSEAARLDPDLRARALAIRALARIGGESAVVALADAYPSAPPELQRELVYAWSVPQTFAAGGQRALIDLAGGPVSEGGVLAALSLYGRSDEGRALAERALVQAIEGQAAGARLLALEVGPWDSQRVRGAIEAARSHSDPATRVVALLRRVEESALDAADTAALTQLGTDTVTPVGAVARAALARAGQANVEAALRADLKAKKAEHRMLAAWSLLLLRDWSGAAQALGDDSPAVRRALACRVLAEPGARSPASRYPGGKTSWHPARPDALLPASASATALPPPGDSTGFPEVVPLLVAAPPG
jgi:hypothetical protein